MTALPRHGLVAAAAVALAVLAGCGQEAQTLDSASTAPLHQRVQAVRVALEAQDVNGARAALDDFRADVQRLADGGGINRDDAQVLIAQAEQIDAALPQPASAPQTTTAPRPDGVTVAPNDTGPEAPANPPDTQPAPQAPREQAPVTTPRDDPPPDPRPENPRRDEPRPDDPRPNEPDVDYPDRGPDPEPQPEPEPEPENPEPQQPDNPAPDTAGDLAGDVSGNTGNGANYE